MAARETLKPPVFSAKVQAALHALDLATAQQVREYGASGVFLLLKKSGLTLTRSVLWQLDAFARGVALAEIDDARKSELTRCLKSHPPVALFPPAAHMENFMRAALHEAAAAEKKAEVPVGAVVVHQGEIIARAHNQCICRNFIGAHAEMLAMARAGEILGNYRLEECDLYVTLEPCAMCMGALLQARIARLVFAAAEPKSGASGSVTDLSRSPLNTHTAVHSGICAAESRALLRNFFHQKRRAV